MRAKDNQNQKVLIIGLDGVPYSFIRHLLDTKKNDFPHFSKLFENGAHSHIKSVLPTVSGVAWTAIFTGKNPAKFGVFGFLDLKKDYTPYIPNATSLKTENLLDTLSREGKRVVSLGVPMTYPPKTVNGICVGGFLTPSLNKGVYPKSFLPLLEEEKYVVDINPMKARESLDFFTEELTTVFEARKNTMIRLIKGEPWDFFITHFIDTDRINHFLWHYYQEKVSKYKDFFLEFYRKIDDMLGKVMDLIDKNTILIVLSDHGFCKTTKEIQLNYWLKENGYLKFKVENPRSFKDIDEESLAFSLTPGRIYIHTDIWKDGSVSLEKSGKIVEEIIEKLSKVKDPETQQLIFKNIYRREEYYSGKYLNEAPEIIIKPVDGYELKAKLDASNFFNPPDMPGIHTFDDAMIALNRKFSLKEDIIIYDVFPTVLEILGVKSPENIDGESILRD